MLSQNPHIVDLSGAFFSVRVLSMSPGKIDRIVDSGSKETTHKAEEKKLPKDHTMQLTLFAGLFLLFVITVGLLFLRYRNRRRTTKKSPVNPGLSSNLWKTNPLSTQSLLTSESVPAILVAHHDQDLRLFITNTLRLSYRVISTTDGEEAFEKAFELVPDLVITDCNMPGIDGPLLCRRIKMSEATSHIPIVLIGHKEGSHFAMEHWQEFADDHLPEKFDAKELLTRVHQRIQDRKNLQEEYKRHEQDNESESKYLVQEQPFLFKLKRVLRTYHSDPLFGVEQLTDQLHMSRLQLYRKLKALTSQSPGDFIRSYRVEQAKNMLAQEGLSVADAAVRAGFSNVSSFNRAFKDSTGKTPHEYVLENASDNSTMVEEEQG